MAKLIVQVHPKGARNSVIRCENGVWHLKITAPPVEGKANKELIEFLVEVLDISKSRLSIDKGETSHRKTLLVDGLTDAQINERLQEAVR